MANCSLIRGRFSLSIVPLVLLMGSLTGYGIAGTYDQNSALIEAARVADLQRIERLLQQGADVNVSDPYMQQTPLMKACAAGDEQCVKALLNAGAELEAKDRLGRTALVFAVQSGNPAILGMLLDKGAEVDARDKYRKTPLIMACDLRRLEVAGILLDRGADVNAAAKNGSTPLTQVFQGIARNRDVPAIVRLLLAKGANVNVIGGGGWTPLGRAVSSGSVDAVKLLLENGARVNEKDRYDRNALISAALLHQYVKEGIIQLLVEHNADVNAAGHDGKTALDWAFSEHHFPLIKALLLHHPNGDCEARHGFTPLMKAAVLDDVEQTASLLKEGADMRAKDKNGHDAFLLACVSGSKGVADLFLEQSPKSSFPTDYKLLVLSSASHEGQNEIVKLLMDKGWYDDVGVGKGDRIVTPLIAACAGGHPDVVRMLLRNGADVNAKDADGETAFSRAVERGNEELVRLLLEHGADPLVRDKYGDDCLASAVWFGPPSIVKLLLDKGLRPHRKASYAAASLDDTELMKPLLVSGGDVTEKLFGSTIYDDASSYRMKALIRDYFPKPADPNATLLDACRAGDLQKADQAVQSGASVDTSDQDGWTPLIWVSSKGYPVLARYLLSKGANIGIRDEQGRTPLIAAAEQGHNEIVEIYLDSGADINAREKFGETSLNCAARIGYEGLVETLVKRGADVNTKTDRGETPLMAASKNGDIEMVRLLVKNGADVSAGTKDGTALTRAAGRGHAGIVRLLIAKGAKMDEINDRDGETPLMKASVYGYLDVVKALIENGANVRASNKYGSTALMMAARNGHPKVAELLIAKGAHVNAKDGKGRTALTWAEKRGYGQLVELLKKHGARE